MRSTQSHKSHDFAGDSRKCYGVHWRQAQHSIQVASCNQPLPGLASFGHQRNITKIVSYGNYGEKRADHTEKSNERKTTVPPRHAFRPAVNHQKCSSNQRPDKIEGKFQTLIPWLKVVRFAPDHLRKIVSGLHNPMIIGTLEDGMSCAIREVNREQMARAVPLRLFFRNRSGNQVFKWNKFSRIQARVAGCAIRGFLPFGTGFLQALQAQISQGI
jgi:hypothetical protein